MILVDTNLKFFWGHSMPCGYRPRVVGELDVIGVRGRKLQQRQSRGREVKGIGKGAIVNMNHGIKTE